MAKKFAAIEGLHNFLAFDETNNRYLLSEISPEGIGIDHNTVCFVSADSTDVGRLVGSSDAPITINDRYIIVQNDIFALYGDKDISPTPDQTWRPICVKGAEVLSEAASGKLNFEDSTYVKTRYTRDLSTNDLALRYDIDVQSLANAIVSLIILPSVETPNDGELQVEISDSTVHTDKNTSHDVEIPQNTLSVRSTYIEDQVESDPEDPENPIIEPVEVEGNFTANTDKDTTVSIHYKGTADRVDWWVDGETRDENDSNDSNAKKFVYIECMQEFFKPISDAPFIALNDYGKTVISEDSIVFITCGKKLTNTSSGTITTSDAEIFDNPEYYDGARFIWTHNKMFSANTWLPIFTRETVRDTLMGLTPPIGTAPHGARLIIQGANGVTVSNSQNESDGYHERIITISGPVEGGGGGTGETGHIYDAGHDSLAEGVNPLFTTNTASGMRSHAEGIGTTASGADSHAEGNTTKASGEASHAEGFDTDATGLRSHAEGDGTTASGIASHAEGLGTTASGDYSHAEGNGAEASGAYSHAEGYNQTSTVTLEKTISTLDPIVKRAFNELYLAKKSSIRHIYNDFDFFMNISNEETTYIYDRYVIFAYESENAYLSGAKPAIVFRSKDYYYLSSNITIHYDDRTLYDANDEPIGTEPLYVTIPKGLYLRACDTNGFIEGPALGGNPIEKDFYLVLKKHGAFGVASHTEGFYTEASNDYTHAEGHYTEASGRYSHAEGVGSKASEAGTHAEGFYTEASGFYSHAEGFYTEAAGEYGAHAEGNYTKALGAGSHAEGYDTEVSGSYAHAEGENTLALGVSSHVEGTESYAYGKAAHAEGLGGIRYRRSVPATIYGADEQIHILTSDMPSELLEALFNTLNGGIINYSQTGERYIIQGGHFRDSREGHYTLESTDDDHIYLYRIPKDPVRAARSINDVFGDSTVNINIDFAYGQNAMGIASHSEGHQTAALGDYSHSEGDHTIADGYAAHTEGMNTKAENNGSHVEGISTIASGEASHAEGYGLDSDEVVEFVCSKIGTAEQTAIRNKTGITFTYCAHNDDLDDDYASQGYIYYDETCKNLAAKITICRFYSEGNYSGDYFNIESGTLDNGTYYWKRVCGAGGDYSHSEGYCTSATKDGSHAEGENTTASGTVSHAEGIDTTASGNYSHAEGIRTTASGETSHAEGGSTTASGSYSHAEGSDTTASGETSHAEGESTTASGTKSHAEGFGTKASNHYSHAEGNTTTASGESAHAEGQATTASGAQSHAEGNTTTASGESAHAEGASTTAQGISSHAEGQATTASGAQSHAEGLSTQASGPKSHAEGYETTASKESAHAEGLGTRATGKYSHAEGQTTTASGQQSHAEGYSTTASGGTSHAEGNSTTASGGISHAEGSYTTASGGNSHAEGSYTTASGARSHVEGQGLNSDDIVEFNCAIIDASEKAAIRNKTGITFTYCDHNNGIYDTYGSQGYIYSDAACTNLVVKITICRKYSTGNYSGAYFNTEYQTSALIHNRKYYWKRVCGAEGENSHAEGSSTKSWGAQSHAEGSSATASGSNSHAEGEYTTAFGNNSHAEGSGTTAYEARSHAEGYNTIASGISSHAEGYNTTASGQNSHAEGEGTTTFGSASHAEGLLTTASANYSHAEGQSTTASGSNSHAEGRDTQASEQRAHAEGYRTRATKSCAHAEGARTEASGDYSHAECDSTIASGNYSHAEGSHTTASGLKSHAEGSNTSATEICTHAEGKNTEASGWYSHSEGMNTIASGNYSHAEGYSTQATHESAHTEGYETTASGNYSHAEGYSTQATQESAHAEGYGTTASGDHAHAEGSGTTASGGQSHAEGYNTTASSDYSHAEGSGTTASSEYSHAEGYNTTAEGESSHAEGSGTTASGISSHAEGYNTTATGDYSHASGQGTIIKSEGGFVCGTYNDIDEDEQGGDLTHFQIGGGSSTGGTTTRSNILSIWDASQAGKYTMNFPNGTIICDSVQQTSDERKKNITGEIDLNKAYELIDKCQTILYTLKDTPQDKEHIGLIAQEVHEIFPELVNIDNKGYMSLDYSRLTVIIFKVLKDVIRRLNDLEKNK